MSGCEVSIRLGFSFVGRKKGLFAYSSAIVALEASTECVVWDWVLVMESEAMDEKRKAKNKTLNSVWELRKWKRKSQKTYFDTILNKVKEREIEENWIYSLIEENEK